MVGVIPQALFDKELAHKGLSELHVVGSMHERKAMMADLADAFIALPGGFGTLDEIFETATLIQTQKIQEFPLVLMGKIFYFLLTSGAAIKKEIINFWLRFFCIRCRMSCMNCRPAKHSFYNSFLTMNIYPH